MLQETTRYLDLGKLGSLYVRTKRNPVWYFSVSRSTYTQKSKFWRPKRYTLRINVFSLSVLFEWRRFV